MKKEDKCQLQKSYRNYSEVQSRIDMGIISDLQNVSARQFSVMCREEGIQLVGKQSNISRECASLTKIMTS